MRVALGMDSVNNPTTIYTVGDPTTMSFIRNGLCAALLSISATASQAAEVTVNFNVEVIGDIPAYVGLTSYGTLVYNNEFLTGSGEEALAFTAYTADPLDPDDYDVVAGLVSFSMTMFVGETFEQTFTAADDAWEPDFPEFYFFDGELYGVDFVVDELFTPIDAPGVDVVLAAYNCFCGGEFTLSAGAGDPNVLTAVVASPIPVPAALPLMLGGLGLLGVAARRRKG
jgi:hypothetical protein